jgi:hypothetical protein
MEAGEEVRMLRERLRRLERTLFCVAALGVGVVVAAAKTADAAKTPVADTVEACRFVLRDREDQVVATLGCEGELHLPRLRFYNSLNSRLLMELGTDGLFGGCAMVKLLDNYSGGSGDGATIVLENEGDPGCPTIRLSTAPGEFGCRVSVEAALERHREGASLILRDGGGEVWRSPAARGR